MKFLIVLCIVGYAAAETYWEPDDDTPRCIICGDPPVQKYDKVWTILAEAQKSALSRWAENQTDPCRFYVTGVTKVDKSGQLILDWIAANVHIHENRRDHYRSFVFFQKNDKISKRGQGTKKTNMELPYTWPETEAEVELITYRYGLPPACDPEEGPTYAIFRDEDDPNWIKMRSPCCPWALDWYPDGPNTCLIIYVGEYYQGELSGICGDADGDMDDEWALADGTPCANKDEQCLLDMSDSYDTESNHNGQNNFNVNV